MAVGKVTPVSSITPSSAVVSVTSRSKSIQNQIQAKEQNLNRLSTDTKLSIQEKEKKRQELQKEIEELNRKLELMRMEKKEEEKKAEMKKEREELIEEQSPEKTSESKASKSTSSESKATENKASDTSHANTSKPEEESITEEISIEDVQNMLSSNMTLHESLIENSADFDRENTVRLLQSEIKLDELHGMNADSKEEQLEELREKENFWIEAKYAQEEASRQTVQLSIAE